MKTQKPLDSLISQSSLFSHLQSSFDSAIAGLASTLHTVDNITTVEISNSLKLLDALLTCTNKHEFELSYKNIDWNNFHGCANLLFMSSNKDAIALSPINWLKLKSANNSDSNYDINYNSTSQHTFKNRIFSAKNINSRKSIWLVKDVLNLHQSPSSHHFKEIKKIQNNFLDILLDEGLVSADSMIDGYAIDLNKKSMRFLDLLMSSKSVSNKKLLQKVLNQSTWSKESSEQTLLSLASSKICNQSVDEIDPSLMYKAILACLDSKPDFGVKFNLSNNINLSLASIWLYVIDNEKYSSPSVEVKWRKKIKKELSTYISSLDFKDKDELFKDFLSLHKADYSYFLERFSPYGNSKSNFTSFILPFFYSQEKQLESFLVKTMSITSSDQLQLISGKMDFDNIPVKINKIKAKYICKRLGNVLFSENASLSSTNSISSASKFIYDSEKENKMLAQKNFLPGLIKICDQEASKMVQSLIDILSDKSINDSKKSLKFMLEIQSKNKPKAKTSRKF